MTYHSEVVGSLLRPTYLAEARQQYEAGHLTAAEFKAIEDRAVNEAISVCLHKPQVYIDLSGWSPKYFPPQLIQYANTQLKRKILFGSDYPLITPDRWLADFEKAPFRDEVRPLILKENAVRLLNLDKPST